MPICCVCETQVPAWQAHPGVNQRSQFMVLMEAVGSDLSVFRCPACACIDRDRHLWMYMAAAGLPEQLAGARVLHLAPEQALEPLIQACGPARYVRGDLYPARAGIERINAEQLPFANASFDLIIANHLLEHVAEPARALAEFHRCLSPGGMLIAQTPYAPHLRHTFELDSPTTAEFRRLFYGQDDHVRLFGQDLVATLHAAGFTGELLPHEQLLPGFDPQEFGVNGREPFFAFSKPETASADSASASASAATGAAAAAAASFTTHEGVAAL